MPIIDIIIAIATPPRRIATPLLIRHYYYIHCHMPHYCHYALLIFRQPLPLRHYYYAYADAIDYYSLPPLFFRH